MNAVCSRAACKTIKVWQILIEIKLEALCTTQHLVAIASFSKNKVSKTSSSTTYLSSAIQRNFLIFPSRTSRYNLINRHRLLRLRFQVGKKYNNTEWRVKLKISTVIHRVWLLTVQCDSPPQIIFIFIPEGWEFTAFFSSSSSFYSIFLFLFSSFLSEPLIYGVVIM